MIRQSDIEHSANMIPQRVGVIIIKHEGTPDRSSDKFLCVHQNASKLWGFPKGRLKESESYEEGASRELMEETGVYISPQDLKEENTLHIKRGKHHHHYFIHYTNTFPIVTIDGYEIMEYKWLTLQQLSQLNTSYFTEQVIKRMSG